MLNITNTLCTTNDLSHEEPSTPTSAHDRI